MTDVTAHKGMPFAFHDLEPERGSPSHLATHHRPAVRAS